MNKTLTIDDLKHISSGARIYLTEKSKYGVIGFGTRWFIIDIERNFEGDSDFFSKKQALAKANKFEQQQFNEGFENDNNVYNDNNQNLAYWQTFGQNNFFQRYHN